MKTHLSLNVADLDASVRFYEALFGAPAHKRRPGYANFDVENPPLKLALVEEKNLANVKIHDGDARPLLDALPAASFERIYLLYPDPWPKARHNKRRFVSQENLGQFHRVLQPGGLFLFASDIDDYVAWTRQHVAEHGGFAEEGDPAVPYENWIETRYENKAKREGRSSAYLTFLKV